MMSDAAAAVLLLRAALENKIAMLLAMLTAAAAFAWCLYAPDWIRFTSATTYTALTYIAVLRSYKSQEDAK
jgi:hypothetical protein